MVNHAVDRKTKTIKRSFWFLSNEDVSLVAITVVSRERAFRLGSLITMVDVGVKIFSLTFRPNRSFDDPVTVDGVHRGQKDRIVSICVRVTDNVSVTIISNVVNELTLVPIMVIKDCSNDLDLDLLTGSILSTSVVSCYRISFVMVENSDNVETITVSGSRIVV